MGINADAAALTHLQSRSVTVSGHLHRERSAKLAAWPTAEINPLLAHAAPEKLLWAMLHQLQGKPAWE
jgi:hypothetical protein